jgi:hypothetical protein
LSRRNDPSRRSLNIIGCSGSGPVRADPAFGNGGYGDGTPHPGAAAGGGPHPGGGVAGGPGGWPGGSQGGGWLVTTFLASALARIVTRPHGPVNGVRGGWGNG